MERKPYYTDAFYSDPYATLDVLNKLKTTKFVKELDMYSSGSFLTFEVERNDITEKIVSKVINDIDTYLNENNTSFSYTGTDLDFSALVEDHTVVFDDEDIIKWDAKDRVFCCASDLWEDYL